MALKIVVIVREQGTGNREQKRGFQQLYCSLFMSVFSVHLFSRTQIPDCLEKSGIWILRKNVYYGYGWNFSASIN
ncbi:MAG: hypothetical protein ACK6A9_10435 [Dolichospermum sp.]|uniref:Transposase n=1 Tax=Dolichospermum circinale CS-537/01 TaxID=3021739 RepID=A0ABT5A320_9CYAN|nr:hypothetical protein [Dolichospermum circinale]MDB9486325.1 hypothetical protein [Dolichospermum circinale CS-537/01]